MLSVTIFLIKIVLYSIPYYHLYSYIRLETEQRYREAMEEVVRVLHHLRL